MGALEILFESTNHFGAQMTPFQPGNPSSQERELGDITTIILFCQKQTITFYSKECPSTAPKEKDTTLTTSPSRTLRPTSGWEGETSEWGMQRWRDILKALGKVREAKLQRG